MSTLWNAGSLEGQRKSSTVNIRDLDRLVSRTEITPASKLLLRAVRKSAMRGKVRGPQMSRYTWAVIVEDFGSSGATFRFNIKRTE